MSKPNAKVKPPSTKAFHFVKNYVHTHPDATFKDVKMAGRRSHLKVLPIQYGKVLQMIRQTERKPPKHANGAPSAAPLAPGEQAPVAAVEVDASVTISASDVLAQAADRMRQAEGLLGSIGLAVKCEFVAK